MKTTPLGKYLVEAEIITQKQLDHALKSQSRYPNWSIGKIIHQMFTVPMEIIETMMITRIVTPIIESWFKKNIDQKSQKDGIPLSTTIKDFTLTIHSYTRYEGEAVTFIRNKMGYYCEDTRESTSEKLSILIDTVKLTTRRQQEILLYKIKIAINLETNKIKAENPGFITEARLKLLHAIKQKYTL